MPKIDWVAVDRRKLSFRYLRALQEAVKIEDIQEMTQAIVTLAKGGNVLAYREIMDRLIGKPTVAIELDAHVDAKAALSHSAIFAAILSGAGLPQPPALAEVDAEDVETDAPGPPALAQPGVATVQSTPEELA